MNGAESLVRTLVAGGVDVCFTNPGTSEMHFVVALDRVEQMRCVLCLFEGVATGAADGYARMADRPAATLLHLGPGLGNGLANLHNARKGRSPVVNIVGEHATHHLEHDAPLTADIEGIARPVSAWVKTSRDALSVAADGAEAIRAALTPPGQVATLILPADTAWKDGSGPAAVAPPPPRRTVEEEAVVAAARVLKSGEPVLLLLGDRALREKPLELAARIAGATGARVMAPTGNARIERGAGRFAIDRVPYVVDLALQTLAPFRHVIRVGAKAPVAFFGYPGKPSVMTPEGCEIHTLAEPADDLLDALERLAEAVGATRVAPRLAAASRPPLPRGALDPDTIGAVLGALLPEGAIVCDESITTGRNFAAATKGAPPHDWLGGTGGSIGAGMPMAVGAAVACPDRKVINLEADGSGMYTLQALWTEARENLDVTTLVWSNRSYAILRHELANVGAGNPGRKALDMLSLDNPALDWVALARGMGVEAARADTLDGLIKSFEAALARRGPFLIDVVL